MRYIAIGDIHGCLDELQRLLARLHHYMYKDNVTWIFLGDYVDRGPNVKGVVDLLLEFAKIHNCVFLKGNHEDMMMDAYEQGSWMRNGGQDTIRSYEGDKGEAFKKHLDLFYRRLWMKYETDTHFFCHAGVSPNYELDDQLPVDLLWIRQTFLKSDKDFGKIIVHGHTPESTTSPVIKDNRINIDQGCVFGGRLTALIIEEGSEKFVQVDSQFSWWDK